MPTKKTAPTETVLSADHNGVGTAVLSELASATRTLAQAVQALNATMSQIQQTPSAGAGLASAVTGVQIHSWEDDPFSEVIPTADPPLAAVVALDFQANVNPLLRTAITAPQPSPSLFAPGTPEFLYWCAEEALARGINFWTPLLPQGTTWSEIANPIPVVVDAGEDLRARFMRDHGLLFYHCPVRDTVIFTGESPDTVLHELGHAILDAVQPSIWDTLFFEVDAFHEAFADMSAVLGSLQLPSMRQKTLVETAGRLNVNSRLSRIAERFGWGFRRRKPTQVEPDCLRNAANTFHYRLPDDLEPTGPAHQLTREPHSLCRIMTGAFLDALAAMFARLGPASEARLLDVSRDMGQLLVDAVINADHTNPRYFKEIARAMILSDRARNGGRYRDDLQNAFKKRQILTTEDIAALVDAPTPAVVEIAQPDGADLTADIGATAVFGARTLLTFDPSYTDYARSEGLTEAQPQRPITTSFGAQVLVHGPEKTRRPEFALADALPSTNGAPAAEDEERLFLDSLIQNGRIECDVSRDLAPVLVDVVGDSSSRKTHAIAYTPNGVELKRIAFDCALGGDG